MRPRTALLTILMLMLAVVGSTGQALGGDEYRDYDVEAAFIYNFVKFVDWPSEAFARGDAPLVIGVVGDDPFGPALEKMVQGKEINGRAFAVRHLGWNDDFRSRQVLFVGSTDSGRIRQLLDRLRGLPVLTVGETAGFARRGGVINFYLDQSRVRFEINVNAARRARLTISSRLLSVARIVSDG